MNFLTLTVLFLSFNAHAITGKQVAKKVYESNREPDAIQKTRMTLIDKKGNKRVRNFIAFAKDNNSYDAQTIILFTKPKSIDGTVMLTHNKKGDDTIQWIYLSGLKKSRRIGSSKKSGRFVGSDLTYEDLEDREPEMDHHKLLRTKKLGKNQYYIIQSHPKDKSTSSYKRIISWVNSKTWMVKKSIFYKKKKKAHKTITVSKFKKIGKSWRAIKTKVVNHKIKHTTLLEVSSTKFNNDLKPNHFKKLMLENPDRLKRLVR
jgi:hypothetical protein